MQFPTRDADPLAHIRAWISCQKWTRASTVEDAQAHEYVVMKGENWHFARWFGPYVRQHGYPESFLGRVYHYLDVDGFRYWLNSNAKGLWFVNRAEGTADGTADAGIRDASSQA